MRISKESITIGLVGLADLITTIYWVQYKGADEANPLFAFFLSMGIGCFTVMKLIMLACPIYVLEYARMRCPDFTRRASRCAIAAYLSLYLVGVVNINPHLVGVEPVYAASGSRHVPASVLKNYTKLPTSMTMSFPGQISNAAQ
jgi:hypothetical protein